LTGVLSCCITISYSLFRRYDGKLRIEEETYDAGYYDGLWYAYNDGYFVSYDYGFTIGFSEGYDIGFSEFWYDFLVNDSHPEYYEGSFMDGYQDDFSKGSVFGARGYDVDFPFDWEGAMWDYRSGTDIFIEELFFGTGGGGITGRSVFFFCDGRVAHAGGDALY